MWKKGVKKRKNWLPYFKVPKGIRMHQLLAYYTPKISTKRVPFPEKFECESEW